MFRLPQEPSYEQQGGRSHRLVATELAVTLKGIPTAAERVIVPREVLPFGLLSAISVECVDNAAAAAATGDDLPPVATKFRLRVQLITGERAPTKWFPFGPRRIALVGPPFGTDLDADHGDLEEAFQKTGHKMQFRSVAASTLTEVAILLPTPANGATGTRRPPCAIRVTFHGQNLVPEGVDVPALAKQVAEGVPGATSSLHFKYVAPHQRAYLMSQVVKEFEARAAAATSTGDASR